MSLLGFQIIIITKLKPTSLELHFKFFPLFIHYYYAAVLPTPTFSVALKYYNIYIYMYTVSICSLT